MRTTRAIAWAIGMCMSTTMSATSPALTAQSRPDFSGEWVRAVDSTAGGRSVAATGDASFQRGDMGSGWGSPLTIKQDSAKLTVQYVFFSTYDLQPPIMLQYQLNGSESRNTLNIGHTTSEQRSRVSWDGSTLIVTTLEPGPTATDGRPIQVEMRQALSLQSPTTLRVVTTRAGILGAATTTTTVTYTKR